VCCRVERLVMMNVLMYFKLVEGHVVDSKATVFRS
jgi:hypothetical protein